MKKTTLLSALMLGLALVFAATGCKHKPISTTVIPGTGRNVGGPEEPGGTLRPGETTDGGIPIDEKSYYGQLKASGNYNEDRGTLASDTIYFDTDSATIQQTEQSKLQHVADYLKGNSKSALEVEGHCDERGTEGYNLSLGDKRALAIREYLANLGVDAGHIGTVSFGEAKPAENGDTEAAFKKNRRGVFVVLQPK